MFKRLLTLFISALALCAGLTALAAQNARQAPNNPQIQKQHATQKQSATAKKAMRQHERVIAAQDGDRTRSDSINNDAGVPPSGVPSETMHA